MTETDTCIGCGSGIPACGEDLCMSCDEALADMREESQEELWDPKADERHWLKSCPKVMFP